MKVCWISAGVSSFVAGYLARETVDEYLYIDISDQHPDSLRFIHDCETALGRQIKILRSSEYKSVEDAVLGAGTIRNGRNLFYPCTNFLKKRVRKLWEYEHRDEDITYVWGFDVDEKHRAERCVEGMPDFGHEFPLIERNLTKDDAHGICAELGVKRPLMYELGYSNNNCVGCLKGGAGYWNKIRVDFPEVFKARAELERRIGQSMLRQGRKDATPLFLDELDPSAGRMSHEIMEECSIFCQMAIDNN